MKLFKVALVLTIFINIIALLKAIVNDIHFDLRQNLLYRLAIGETVCYAKQLGGHWALIYREFMDSLDLT